MSRIGRMPINVPAGVEVTIGEGNVVTVKGPKGELTKNLHPNMNIAQEGNVITVTVGSVEHPMLPEHYIQWIVLETENGFRVAELKPGDKPEVKFFENEKVIAVYEYCNLHGLWKTSV